MSNILYVVVDVSGSMIEMAKMSISMNILSFIREYDSIHQNTVCFDKIIILKWNETVETIELDKDNELENFIPSGKLNFTSLQDELVKIRTEDIPLKILLLSDGNYDDSELKKFQEWCKNDKNLYIAAVVIGADTLEDYLKEISINENVYSPEDIISAIKSLESINEVKYDKPESIGDIVNITTDEYLDEWS